MGGKAAELDTSVDNLLPRVGLPVVDEQEEAAKEITADQQSQHDSKWYRSCNNVNININSMYKFLVRLLTSYHTSTANHSCSSSLITVTKKFIIITATL